MRFPYSIAALIFARISAMAFNRVADVKFDALNPRLRSGVPKVIISRNTARCCLGRISVVYLFIVLYLFLSILCLFPVFCRLGVVL